MRGHDLMSSRNMFFGCVGRVQHRVVVLLMYTTRKHGCFLLGMGFVVHVLRLMRQPQAGYRQENPHNFGLIAELMVIRGGGVSPRETVGHPEAGKKCTISSDGRTFV